MAYHDTIDELLQYLDGFQKRHKGYYPKNVEKWFDRVERSHKKARELLGGIRKQAIIKFESNQNPIDIQQARPYIDEIKGIVPNYLAQYGYTEDVFLMPTIQEGTHATYKVGKHVRSYAERNVRDKVAYGDRTQQMARLDKALSQLGGLWAKARTTENELEVTISTSAKAFLLLGHYGPDVDSCFRNGSDKTNHKFVLGQTPDTFVISIAKFSEKKKEFRNVARAFGWFSNNYKTINICNLYLKRGFVEGDALHVMQKTCEDILESDNVKMQEQFCTIYGTGEPNNGIFNNPQCRYSFTAGSELTEIQTLMPVREFIQIFRCPNCRDTPRSEDGWEDVDDRYVCSYCVSTSHKCDVTGKRTFKSLVEINDENGNILEVHPEYAAKLIKCNECNVPTTMAVNVDKLHICPNCIETYYDECEECRQYVSSTEINDIGDRLLCNNCIEAGHDPFDMELVAS